MLTVKNLFDGARVCPACPEWFASLAALTQHLTTAHAGIYECGTCREPNCPCCEQPTQN